MKVSRGDLVSAANDKADSSPEAKASHDQAWCHKILFLTVILSILKKVELSSTSGQTIRNTRPWKVSVPSGEARQARVN